MALTLDRKAFIDILTEGQGKIGGAMLPPPEGLWGMPAEMLQTIPGYGPRCRRRTAPRRARSWRSSATARTSGSKSGCRPAMSRRYRDPAVILIDQLKEIYIDGMLDTVETANWHTKVTRKDYAVALNATGSGVDDPDQQFYENYACGSPRNYSGYCNKELDKKFDEQSTMTDQEAAQEAGLGDRQEVAGGRARPIIFHNIGATCMQPQVKGLTHDGQQHLQRLALGGCVARQVAGVLTRVLSQIFVVYGWSGMYVDLPLRCQRRPIMEFTQPEQGRAQRRMPAQLSPSERRLAFPPAAVVSIETVRSVAKRCRYRGPPAFGPVPLRRSPPNGCAPTTAPIVLRLT